ncbi:unnamed protein product [Absidia cylindrospora]
MIQHIIHRVNHFALELIKTELPFSSKASKVGDCVCTTRRNYNLPCRRLLPSEIIPIDASMIDRRWFLTEKDYIDTLADDKKELEARTEMATKRSEVEITFDELIARLDAKNQILVKAIEALKPVVELLDTNLEEIKPPPYDIPLKGRRANTKRSEIKLEIVVEEADKKRAKTVEKKFKANIAKLSKSNEPLSVLCSSISSKKVSDVKNPDGDGNCGFRCLGMAIYNNEKRYDIVKDAMLAHLRSRKEGYLACNWLTEGDIARLEVILLHRGKCGPDLYYTEPECSQLAADTFERPVEFHGTSSATLYLPMIPHTSYKSYRPIVLHLQESNRHIYYVIMKRGNYGYPPINTMHNAICEKLSIPNQSGTYI